MFDCVTVNVADPAASRAFYDLLLDEWHDFELSTDGPPTQALHVAFYVPSRAEVKERWQRAVDAGYRSDGEPGPRPQYSPDYYGGFLVDPDGNSAEVVTHGRRRVANRIDHLWIGVADLAAAHAFWTEVAPSLGLRVQHERPQRFHVTGDGGSFALVADGRPPTRNVLLRFGSSLIDPERNVRSAA
jgi:catechol 2,3-dioxygenase-like lactoylglutathione lyase family enzyme